MTFELTKGQKQGMDMVEALLKHDGPAYGVLTGYAGTGKTTLLKQVAETHGAPLVLTPTGKASLRVTEATGLPASTIHRWMYRAGENPKTGETIWQKKPTDLIELPQNCLIVVDEASMVGFDLWADIWGLCSSINVKVLLVGDRFQLGPVQSRDKPSFNALSDLTTDFHADLVEVTRQALESPVLRASMMLRQSEVGAVEALADVLPGVALNHAVERFQAMNPQSKALIAHRNETRQKLNLEVREKSGRSKDAIDAGEPLLVLYNNYAIDRMNGEIVTFEEWVRKPGDSFSFRDRFKNTAASMCFGVARVDGHEVLLANEEVFAKFPLMPDRTTARNARDYASYKWGYDRAVTPPHLNANFGYCLTAHKAQGSEWDDVLVVIEPSLGNIYGIQGRRWLYTAITRAKKEAVVTFA